METGTYLITENWFWKKIISFEQKITSFGCLLEWEKWSFGYIGVESHGDTPCSAMAARVFRQKTFLTTYKQEPDLNLFSSNTPQKVEWSHDNSIHNYFIHLR